MRKLLSTVDYDDIPYKVIPLSPRFTAPAPSRWGVLTLDRGVRFVDFTLLLKWNLRCFARDR
jgi:hypothetical protein